ncbi:MAG: 2-oxo acid dehydrogenase subunit E2 [Oscillospiraceae bacterium]|nr:2-oxo acid dehydrogenase subunit E2 [Oscillospiraceae bacterium]
MGKNNVRYLTTREKIIANMTSESWECIPHVAYTYEPDVTKLIDELKLLNSSKKGEKITINTLVIKLICEGLKVAPEMNAHIDFNRRLVRGKVTEFEDISITMPMLCVDGNMFTVNMKNFGNKNLDEMTDYINDVNRKLEKTHFDTILFSVAMEYSMKGLKKAQFMRLIYRIISGYTGKNRIEKLRGQKKKDYNAIPDTDKLTYKDVTQGSITVTNVGSLWKDQRGHLTLIEIIPPQVAAIGIGAAQDMPAVIKNENGEKVIAIRKILPLNICIDHRALDFDKVIPFMKKFDEICENPKIIHTWVN